MKAKLFTLLVLVMSMAMVPEFNAQGKGSNAGATAGARTVYYVVVGSFSDLNKAKYFNAHGPIDTEWGCVFKATINGKTYYRVCENCYYSKERAQRRTNEINNNSFTRGTNAWVWASKGEARCVVNGWGNDGSRIVISPQ